MKRTSYHTPEAANKAAEAVGRALRYLGQLPCGASYAEMCHATHMLSEYRTLLERDARDMAKPSTEKSARDKMREVIMKDYADAHRLLLSAGRDADREHGLTQGQAREWHGHCYGRRQEAGRILKEYCGMTDDELQAYLDELNGWTGETK